MQFQRNGSSLEMAKTGQCLDSPFPLLLAAEVAQLPLNFLIWQDATKMPKVTVCSCDDSDFDLAQDGGQTAAQKSRHRQDKREGPKLRE